MGAVGHRLVRVGDAVGRLTLEEQFVASVQNVKLGVVKGGVIVLVQRAVDVTNESAPVKKLRFVKK